MFRVLGIYNFAGRLTLRNPSIKRLTFDSDMVSAENRLVKVASQIFFYPPKIVPNCYSELFPSK